MKKIILLVGLLTPLYLQADHHTIAGPGEGAFNTIMMQADDTTKYVNYLRANPELFKGVGATAAGVCITRSGYDYEGQMFVWSAYTDLASAMHANTLYDPNDAPSALAELRTVKYGVTWKGLKSFRLDPGWERVVRVKVSPENLNAYVEALSELETSIINSGHESFNMGVFVPFGGGVHESQTLMVRSISPTARESGQIADEYFAGASWGRIWEKSRALVDKVVSDTYEVCEQIYTAE
tara:strand:+ start:485 stop:1198 length:714 start_codon:yes stop_codon:yes gene_type:complete